MRFRGNRIHFLLFVGLLFGSVVQVYGNEEQEKAVQHPQQVFIFPEQRYKPDFPDFDDYIVEFQKKYEKGSQEYLKRKAVYEGWRDGWMKEYSKGHLTYLVGANERSDWTLQEREKNKILETKEQQGKQDHIDVIRVSQSAGNPKEVDWRKKGIMTSVKNQGTCGSCWTFATAAYGEARLIQMGEADTSIDLSEQFLLSCTPQCSCNGGYLEYVFQEAATGIPKESSYAYDPYGIVSPFICWTGNKKRVGYIPKKSYRLKTEELETLLQSGPLAISVSATNWEDYKGGIFKCNSYDKVNHAVLLAGYDETSWIIKNQWGSKWGEDGYIRVSKDKRHNCKIGTSAFWMWEPISHLVWTAILLLAVILI